MPGGRWGRVRKWLPHQMLTDAEVAGIIHKSPWARVQSSDWSRFRKEKQRRT